MHKYLKKIPLYIVYSILFGLFISNPVFADTVDYNVNVAPSLKLTIPDSSLILNLNPPSKTFDSKDLTVTVGTNNATGYKLTLSTPNDNTDLERDTSSDTTAISATIPTLDTGTYTESTFTANKWGYKINTNTAIPSIITSDYIPFTSGNTLMERDTAINHDETELSFASKIDYLQPAGAYSTTLQFNIVANPLINYMQDLNPALCTTTPMTVVDKRDNEEYTIAKLADGNCWLLENLRLDISDPSVQAKLTSATTNATDETLNYLKNGGGSSPYPANGVIAKTASSGSWTSDSANPYIATQYKDTTQPASGSSPAGKIGIYYNYCAASAGSYCYVSNASSGDATQDICPAGWRMPTGGASGEYQALYTAYSSNVANFQAALSTPLSGFFDGSGTASYRGSYGYFWSSTRYNGNYMYLLGVRSSTVDPQNHDGVGRGNGFSVRCVLNDTRTISDITTMQEMNPQIAAKMNNGDTATLRDTRDNQDYTIAKINGNVWMTRNLAIGCNGTGSTYGSIITSKTLTSSDSNISADTWDTPTSSLTLGNNYTDPRMECSSTYGAWYNYAAASAETITDGSVQTYDVCPIGWRLPTNAEQSGITSQTSAYSPVAGGYYGNGRLNGTGHGYWWLSTSYSTTNRYSLFWNGTSLSTGYSGRDCGLYLRCIAK